MCMSSTRSLGVLKTKALKTKALKTKAPMDFQDKGYKYSKDYTKTLKTLKTRALQTLKTRPPKSLKSRGYIFCWMLSARD